MCIYFAFEVCIRPINDCCLLECFQALVHSQSISQCRGSRISNSIEFKTVEESTRGISADSESLRINGVGWSMHGRNLQQPMVYKCVFLTLTFPDNKTLSLQLTSVLLVTCYVPVLWPELWLQCQLDHCFWGCSGVYPDMNTLELDSQFHIKQIPCFCCHMAMTTSHYQRRQWYWYGSNDTFHSTI